MMQGADDLDRLTRLLQVLAIIFAVAGVLFTTGTAVLVQQLRKNKVFAEHPVAADQQVPSREEMLKADAEVRTSFESVIHRSEIHAVTRHDEVRAAILELKVAQQRLVDRAEVWSDEAKAATAEAKLNHQAIGGLEKLMYEQAKRHDDSTRRVELMLANLLPPKARNHGS